MQHSKRVRTALKMHLLGQLKTFLHASVPYYGHIVSSDNLWFPYSSSILHKSYNRQVIARAQSGGHIETVHNTVTTSTQ